jgi:hypothetical protein
MEMNYHGPVLQSPFSYQFVSSDNNRPSKLERKMGVSFRCTDKIMILVGFFYNCSQIIYV